ncbi:putative ribonuclease H-like domain-containing protein [Tanacetum coccineum]
MNQLSLLSWPTLQTPQGLTQFDEQRQTLSEANLEIIAYQLGLESVEAQLVVHHKNEVVYEEKIAVLEFEVIDKNKTGQGYRDQLNKNDSSGSELFNSVFDSCSSDGDDNQTNDRPSGVIIKDWVSDDDADIFQSNDLQATNKPSFKKIEFTNAMNESVKPKQAEKPWIITQNPKVDRRDWNGKMTQKLGLGFGFTKKTCFVYGSYNHLIKDCDFHEKRMAKKSVLKNMGKNSGQREIRPVWNNTQRINPQNKFVPSAVLTRSRRVPVSAAKQSSFRAATSTSAVKQVNTATHTNRVNVSKLRTNAFHKVNGVNNVGQTAVSTIKGTGVTDVKASVGCVWRPKMTDLNNVSKDNSRLWVSKRVSYIDPQGRLKHMTGNTDFLTNYQDIDGGFVAFGGSVRGVTDDFSRFSWVFFLASKDETSGILKRFITEIENQLNHKVKVIRCDNGIEFKNREMNEFCGLKGIKREFSVARTLQQNRVTERKNRTLIEAARTILADSLLPTIFWVEAVNTSCYVLNRVLVTKPHNKTPYELITGRPPSISFMRPFGCPVTILNSLDPLGKFDGKAKEGFLVGYSVNSKAFKVFNSQTRKVEENLHVNFFENKPNVTGQGPNCLFDIDSLTNSMNYQPVTAGNQTNKNAGPQEANGDTGLKKSVDDRHSKEKNVSTQQYIVFPLWSSISSSYKSLDESYKNDTADDAAGETPVQKPASENVQALKNVLNKIMDQEKEAKEQSDTIRKEFEAQFNVAGAPRTSNDAGPSFVPLGGSFPDDPLMSDLEDTAEVQNTNIFCSAYDDDDLDTYNSLYADQVMGAEADFNNIEPSTVVIPIPSTRVHSIHPKDQIIGDPRSVVQTRGMTKKSSGERAMIS